MVRKAAWIAAREREAGRDSGGSSDLSTKQELFASGGKIHIKQSKEGTFTAAAKRHGKSVQAFASQVLANKEDYSPAMVKKANFARNAAKWHTNGGRLFYPGGQMNANEQYSAQPSPGRRKTLLETVSDNLKALPGRHDMNLLPDQETGFRGYGGGSFGGAGYATEFEYGAPDVYDWDYVRNTPLPAQVRSFSEAYTEARRQGLPTFQFNGQTYTTDYDPNATLGPRQTETLLLNLREVLDKDKNVIPDSTRVEPYVGQIPGTEKREHRKDLGGFIERLSNAFGGDREKILAFIREEKARRQADGFTDGGTVNKFDGESQPSGQMDRDTTVSGGKLPAATVTATPEEPLFLAKPYVSVQDFFNRWYPQRSSQMANNMAVARRSTAVFPIGIRKNAEKNVKAYTKSITERDKLVGDYSVIENTAKTAGWLPSALTDEEARRALSDLYFLSSLSKYGDAVYPDGGYTDDELISFATEDNKEAFTSSHMPNFAFYNELVPSLATKVHEHTHILYPVTTEFLKKYNANGAISPMRAAAEKIMRKKKSLLGSSRLFTNYARHGLTAEDEDTRKYFKYLTSNDEVVSRLNEIRVRMGLNPKKKITKSDLMLIKKKATEDERLGFLDLFQDDTLLHFFNDVASSDTAAGGQALSTFV